jgi:hypothetical protein
MNNQTMNNPLFMIVTLLAVIVYRIKSKDCVLSRA